MVACIVVVNRRSLRRGMRPLQAILAWLDDYRLGERNKEMPQNTSVTEFRRLGEAISRTTKRNEALFEEQKRFTANASHELQTPLAVIQSRLEMLLDDGQLTEQQMGEVVKALHTLKALARTNRSLLLLSKIAGGQFTSTEAVSMAGTVDRLLPDMEMIYAHKGITVERRNDGDLVLNMDESLATTLATNLLKNAFRRPADIRALLPHARKRLVDRPRPLDSAGHLPALRHKRRLPLRAGNARV